MQVTLILNGRSISTSTGSQLHGHIPLNQFFVDFSPKDTGKGLYGSNFFIFIIYYI
jgi:hypothetical protein